MRMLMEIAEITHPAAWRGDDLLNRDDWIVDLSRELREAIETSDFDIPALKTIQHSLEHGSGATLIRGFERQKHSEERCREIFLKLTEQIGTPISQSAKGEIVFSVRDSGYKDKDPRARGPNTRKRLSFHTDRCDVIAFMCLNRAKSGGENQIVSSMTVFNEIRRRRPDLLEVLMEPFYYLRHTVDKGNEKPWSQQPVFSFQDGHFAASILRVLIDRAYASPDLPDMTPIQREALDFVEEVASEPELHVKFHQDPGDILLLNNWVTLHRRSEFEDYEEPEKKRHILRIWLSVPNSRPISPLFRDNYGATEPGAIRGGMRAAK